MLVYFGVLVFILLVCNFFPKGKPGQKLFICLIPFFAMIALRENWGGDYDSYKYLFDYFNGMSWSEISADENRSEIGFRFLVYISPTYRFFLVLTSLMLTSGLFFFFYKIIPEKYWPMVFVLVFIDKYSLLGDISGIRNGIAVFFFMMGVYFLMQGKKWFYLAVVFGGSLFHSSILLFLPLFFVTNKSLNLKSSSILMLFGIYIAFSALMPSSWASIIDALFTSVDSFAKYEDYMDNTKASYTQGTSFILALFLLYVIAKSTQLRTLTPKENTILKLSFLWFIIRFFPSMGMTDRLFFYADYILFAAMTIVVDKYPDKTIRQLFIGGVFLYFLFYFYIFCISEHFAVCWLIYRHCL